MHALSCREVEEEKQQAAEQFADMVAAASSKEMEAKVQEDIRNIQAHLDELQRHGSRQAGL